MMSKRKIIPLFIFLILLGCEDGVDCSTVLCAGPPTLIFEVLFNGENVFEEGLLTAEDISISGTSPSAVELVVMETTNGSNTNQLLFLVTTEWELQTYDFNLSFGDIKTVNLVTDIGLSSGDCCGGIAIIDNYEIDGAEIENPNLAATISLD